MTISMPSANRQIAKAAGSIMIAFVFSNLVGLIRQILVTNAFGTQSDIDAFNAANRVSETIFNLVAGGALASAFIPAFTALITRSESRRAWRLASAIGNLILIIISIATILAAIFAPLIVRYLLAPGFSNNPIQESLTIQLLRLMLPSALIFGLSGLVMGILNSNQIFFLPALAPAMYQLGIIFGVLVLVPRQGIVGLGWGVVIGAVLHLLLQIPQLIRLGGRYFPVLDLTSPDVIEIIRLMAPRLLGVAVVQLNFWINTRLASQFVEGSVTGIVLAFALMLMPQAAIAQSIAIAAMPTFSAQVAFGKLKELRASLAASLRGALLLSIPASIGLIVLRKPIIASLYQRGEFDTRSTEIVAWALLWYSIGLVGHAVVEILSRAFYSLHDTKTPVIVGIVAMSINIVCSYAFSALFISIGWMALGGLALANSSATAVEAFILLVLMRNRLQGLSGRRILVGAIKALIAAIVMALGLIYWMDINAYLHNIWVVAGGLVVGIGIFTFVSFIIGIDEIRKLFWVIRTRFSQS